MRFECVTAPIWCWRADRQGGPSHFSRRARRQFDDEFKTQAVRLVLDEGKSVGLKWVDVDLDAKLLQVRQALQAITKATAKKYSMEHGLQFVALKTERSRRSLQIPDPIVERLKAHRKAQLELRLMAGKDWIDSGLVFTNSIGKALDPANFRKTFKVLAKATGVPHLRVHDLRHSCATLLLAEGVSERIIMEILGHSQISLTLNTYTHVLDPLKEEAASRMGKVLEGEASGSRACRTCTVSD